MKHIYTDLAIESRQIYEADNKKEIEGVSVEVEEEKFYSISRVKVLNQSGSKKINKPVGTYITMDVPSLDKTDEDLKDEISISLAKIIKDLVKDYKKDKILIIGLGNWKISSDSLGPRVVDRVLVTRQYFINFKKEFDDSMANVAAMSPGVMGITGIETYDIVKGIVDKIKPDLLIAIDALSSRKLNRISTTIQITDTGINPGSGVGNDRGALDKDRIGIPVVAIGIPTVVNAATMARDTIELIIDSLKELSGDNKEFYRLLGTLSSEDQYMLIEEALGTSMSNIIVTPKDIDVLIDDFSIILANGLNMAIHPGIDLKDVNRYIR